MTHRLCARNCNLVKLDYFPTSIKQYPVGSKSSESSQFLSHCFSEVALDSHAPIEWSIQRIRSREICDSLLVIFSLHLAGCLKEGKAHKKNTDWSPSHVPSFLRRSWQGIVMHRFLHCREPCRLN